METTDFTDDTDFNPKSAVEFMQWRTKTTDYTDYTDFFFGFEFSPFATSEKL